MSGTKETGINMAGEEEGKEPGVWHDGPVPVGCLLSMTSPPWSSVSSSVNQYRMVNSAVRGIN